MQLYETRAVVVSCCRLNIDTNCCMLLNAANDHDASSPFRVISHLGILLLDNMRRLVFYLSYHHYHHYLSLSSLSLSGAAKQHLLTVFLTQSIYLSLSLSVCLYVCLCLSAILLTDLMDKGLGEFT